MISGRIMAVALGLAATMFPSMAGAGDHRRGREDRYERRVEVVRPPVVVRDVRPVIIAPRVVVAPRAVRPYVYARPYYAPRPSVGLSIGVTVGRPFPYRAYGYRRPAPYPGYVPVPYPVQSSYPQYAPAPASAVGGVTFDFSPADAALFVDGEYVGVVGQFDSGTEPLSLAAGRHRVEVQAHGYVSMAFDVDIIAGQVVPYEASLRPY